MYSMESIIINGIGYLALLINLYSMSLKGEYKLRLISALANTVYIAYGILLSAWPIIFGCTIAVFLHIYRLKTLKHKEND